MRVPSFPAVVAFQAAVVLGALTACGGQSTIKPAEVLDEKTGITVGALQAPIEFIESAQNTPLTSGKRTSFAYLGPIEWDRMGEITYALWIHVAPGNDAQVGDIRARGAVTLILDDGPMTLAVTDAPKAGKEPYRPIASWGQTGYYQLNVEMLKRIAASQKIALDFRAADATVDFQSSHDTRGTLTQFLHSRGITDD